MKRDALLYLSDIIENMRDAEQLEMLFFLISPAKNSLPD